MTTQTDSPTSGIFEIDAQLIAELGQLQWLKFLQDNQSFHYSARASNASFTARKENSNGGVTSYWYGYRKINGGLHKRYIGKADRLTVSRLEEVAASLAYPAEDRPKPEVTHTQVAKETVNVDYWMRKVGEMTEELRWKNEALAEAKSALEQIESQRPNYDAIAYRVLNHLKMGSQSVAGKAIYAFIKELQRG
ncbi:hypothetical protein H0X32_04180 [Patescibacteria group bacterium]|jgi:hypothetical protein|nr:hypothetical protein [Patescibacteria group bacterium]